LTLAARQHGVFSTHQAVEAGISHHRLRRMALAGEVARVFPRVYRVHGAPRTRVQDVAAVQLWAGGLSLISHDTAGWLLDLGDRPSRVHVTVPFSRRPPAMHVVVHERHDVTRRDITGTVIDMAAISSEETVDLALDAAIRQGMSRHNFLRRLDELAAPGRNGIAVIKKLVAERVTEQGLTESPFERLLLRALRKAKLPMPVCQMDLGDGDLSARADFVYPDQRLVIEADGYRWHDGRAAFERDRLRFSELAARGWRVLLVTWLQLKYRVEEVIDRIRRALEVTVPAPAPDGFAPVAAAQRPR
jgi:very-short-patch-repair endonuclease